MTEPLPFNFGGEPKRPIRNKHLVTSRTKPSAGFSPKNISYHQVVPARTYYQKTYLGTYGIIDMMPGEVKTFHVTTEKKAANINASLHQHAAKNPGWYTVSRKGLALTVRVYKSVDEIPPKRKKRIARSTDYEDEYQLSRVKPGYRKTHRFTSERAYKTAYNGLYRQDGYGKRFWLELDATKLTVTVRGDKP